MFADATAAGAVGSSSSRAPSLLRGLFSQIARGALTVTLPSGRRFAHVGALPGPQAHWQIRNRRALTRLLARGDVGFAEGWIAGDWTTPDLTQLIMLCAENVAALDRRMEGFWPVRLWRVLGHALKRNSIAGSRRNISFHYDLGNAFYARWLDKGMMYSSARAIRQGQTLEAAQAERLDHIAGLLALAPGQRVLEIGCGWGAMAARIAREGAHLTGLTLSREQLAHAQAMLAREGLAGQTDLRLQDYRHEDGQYDRIVSIEMIEAVGEQWWPTYFGKLKACLRPGGRIVLQGITIREDRFAAYKRSPDFIQRYIFPGGMLPTPAILRAQVAAAGLRIAGEETFGLGYAQTLAEWRRRFLQAWDEIAPMGFDERFRRTWEYYLSYCEAGFRTGTIDVGLTVLEHAD